MAKKIKSAEKALTDAGKFPIESCRERLARRFGQDAVALSGPYEGQPLVDSVCTQLSDRWDNIKERFAGNEAKVFKLADKLANSFAAKDDTEACEKDLQAIGYDKTAAGGISNWLKAYAMGDAMEMEMADLINDVDSMAPEAPEAGLDDMNVDLNEGMGDDMGGEPVVEQLDDLATEEGDEGPLSEEMGGDLGAPEGDLGSPEGTVTIDLPVEVAKDLVDSLSDQIAADDSGAALPEPEGAFHGDLPGDMAPEGDLPGDDMVDMEAPMDDVPGEPEGMQEPDIQVVTGDEEETASAPMMGDNGGTEQEVAGPAMDKAENKPLSHSEHQSEEKEEHKKIEEIKKIVEDIGQHEEKEEKQYEKPESDKKEDDDKNEKKEASMLRAGHIRKVGQTLLKLGPEMSINNTDQLGGHDGKKLGDAKEKAVEEPKPLPEGNVHTEAHSAGDNKFQDGKTMGAEQKFDAKTVNKSEVSGGSGSLMGKDESYPDGKPSVPAGSAPIGGEQFEGGDVSTKGTVIATITPKGVLVEGPDGKFLAKAEIKAEASKELAANIGKIAFNGSGKKFAIEIAKLLRKATHEDGITKTDTSKLEGEKFTNDAEKKPEKDAAAAGKQEKKAADKQVEDPKPVKDNMAPEGHVAGGDKVQDCKTLGQEQKFDAKEVEKSEVSKGESSLMGKDESLPKDKPSVPVGGGQMGEEEFKGDNVSTKGTVIASEQQKREEEINRIKAEAGIREARLKAASVYAADLLRHGNISETEYTKTIEEVAQMPVQAIQQLIASTRSARERVIRTTVASANREEVQPGLGLPVVIAGSNKELSLKDRLVKEMKLTRDLDNFDSMKK